MAAYPPQNTLCMGVPQKSCRNSLYSAVWGVFILKIAAYPGQIPCAWACPKSRAGTAYTARCGGAGPCSPWRQKHRRTQSRSPARSDTRQGRAPPPALGTATAECRGLLEEIANYFILKKHIYIFHQYFFCMIFFSNQFFLQLLLIEEDQVWLGTTTAVSRSLLGKIINYFI